MCVCVGVLSCAAITECNKLGCVALILLMKSLGVHANVSVALYFMSQLSFCEGLYTPVLSSTFSDDLPKLKYLTMCIKESLRIHTTVPGVQRETTKDMTLGGRHVPAGTMINIIIYALHHIKEVWTDPEEYRPDRFSPENIQKMDPYAFCPFSAGPRSETKASHGCLQSSY